MSFSVSSVVEFFSLLNQKSLIFNYFSIHRFNRNGGFHILSCMMHELSLSTRLILAIFTILIEPVSELDSYS